MKSVRYLKAVLTVIAACLVWFCVRDVALVGTATAKTDWIPGRYQLEAPGTGFAFRVDSLSGQVCTYLVGQTDFSACTLPGK